MSQLNTEIIETQKSRYDLLKWKIIVFAALSATGLGLSNKPKSYADLVLCCIPFICAYIDMLWYHLSLRNVAIGYFRRKMSAHRKDNHDPDSTPFDGEYTLYQEWYEEFIEDAKGTYRLEKLCVYLSSVMISMILIVLSTLDFFTKEIGFNHKLLILISGLFGICFAVITKKLHGSSIKKIISTEISGSKINKSTEDDNTFAAEQTDAS